MDPSAWCNPPPPGTDMDEESKQSSPSTKSYSGSIIDQIDPFIRNPEYVKYKRRERSNSRHRRSPSYERHDRYYARSRSRERRHRRRSRSRQKAKHRRSRSRERGGGERSHRHRRYSHSSSRSRSPSYERSSRKSKKHSRRHRSRSRTRSRNRHYHKEHKRRSRTPELNDSLVETGVEEEEDAEDIKENAFKNDGTFLEMFKKMQEEKEKAEAEKNDTNVVSAAGSGTEIKRAVPAFGKRRGGRVLKTGMVEKVKITEETDDGNSAQDPWSVYLKEVKRYKEACCDDDSKTRPLVK